MRMTRRIPLDGEMQDAFTGWRKYYAYLKKPGETARIKRRANRQERQDGKKEIRKGDW